MSHEQCVTIDGEHVVEEETEEDEQDLSVALHDEDFLEAVLPEMHFCADSTTSGDMDEAQAIRKVYT